MKDKYFTTNDFNLSCYLILKGLPIVSIEKDGNRGIFVFDYDKSIDSYYQEYFDLNTQVPLKSFLTVSKDLKNRLHQMLSKEDYVAR